MPLRLQEVIHSLEEGSGRQKLFLVAVLSVLVGVAALFDTLLFRNMTTSEGMEAAQLARNLSEGKGYTSGVIRPLAVRLIQAQRQESNATIKGPLPDLQNPPLYPALLAGWLKLMPFGYQIPQGSTFVYYRPDFWVAVFNQILLLVACWMVFRLGSMMFDGTVGWVSLGVFASTWMYWQMAFSGHAVLLLVVILLFLGECLYRADVAASEETPSSARIMTWAALAGVCVGLGALTRYSFLFLALPVMAYFCFLMKPARFAAGMVSFATFAVLLTPWILRNQAVSGTPFGTAGYAIYSGTESFPDDEVERALHSKLDSYDYHEVRRKVLNNLREVVESNVPRMGGNWLGFLALLGVLVPFRRNSLNRLRWFLFISVVVFALVEAGGRTHLTKDTPDLNSENLMAVLAPLGFVFGAGLMVSMVSQLKFDHPAQSVVILVLLVVVFAFPMVLSILPPRPYISSVVYPPYYPPFFQRIGRMNESGAASDWAKELVMTDVPEGIVWYSRCPAVKLTLVYQNDPGDKVKDDFFEFSDYRKTVRALYLTQRTIKTIPVKEVVKIAPVAGMDEVAKDVRTRWENFIGVILTKGMLPPDFPLQVWAKGLWPDQFYAEAGSSK